MKKGTYRYILVVLFIIAVFCVSTLDKAYAQEKQENKVARFFKNLINWPFGITKKSVEAVEKTTDKAIDTTTATAGSAVDMVTGQPEKIKDVVVEPIKGSGETAYTAVTETAKAPVEGTQETFNPGEAK